VLSAHSRKLADMVSRSQSNEYFSQLPAAAIEALLSWIYFGSRTADGDVAAKLLSFAYTYELAGLVMTCEKTLRKNISQETVLFILQVALHPDAAAAGSDPKLKHECLDFIIKNLEELDLSPMRSMPAIVAAHVVAVLQSSIGTHWAIGEMPSAPAEDPEDGEAEEQSALIRTLSGTHLDKVQPKVSPSFSKGGRKGIVKKEPSRTIDDTPPSGPATPASPKPEQREDKRDDGERKDEKKEGDGAVGNGDEDSFNLDRILPPPQDMEDMKLRSGSSQSGLKQKKKRKKVVGVKDLDEFFG